MGIADVGVGLLGQGRAKRQLLPVLLVAAFIGAAPSLAVAQSNQAGQGQPGVVGRPESRAEAPTERPTATAVRVAEGLTIDGQLDDPMWRTAGRVTEFWQKPGRAVEGAPASEQTEVFIAYDDDRIYIGIRAYYSDPTQIRASRVDRDQIQPDDKVTVYLDPFLDLQRAYGFAVNPYGVQRDAVLTATGGAGGDEHWNALYETAGRIIEDGWTAEMAIPFKSLRYPSREPGEMHRWGFQIERDIESKNEAVLWSPQSSSVMGFITQMGVLEGLTNLSTNRNLEFLPTVTAIQVGSLDEDTGAFGTDHGQEAGINVKYGITSNLTFDFTANPDFSQIGSDRPQIEVNQRFPIFFPELRPFFLEGQEIYEIPGPVTLVHTRTIVDPLLGAKLSGKAGRTTLAVLVADDEAPGKVDNLLDPASGRKAQVLTTRVKFDLYPRSYLGVIFTDREFLNSYSRLAGVDGDFWFADNYRFTFRTVGSTRQDLDGVRLTGPQWNIAFEKEGRNLDYSVEHYRIDPAFGTDLGFVRRVDQRYSTADISYTWWPETWIIEWGPEFSYERGYDYQGDILHDEIATGGLSAQFTRNISLEANVERAMERFRDIDFDKTRFSISGSVDTSRRIAFDAEISRGDEINYIENPYLGRSTAYELGVTLRPTSRLQSEIDLETNRFIDVRNDSEVFDVKVLHAVTTYQFTDRLLVRNILDHDTFDKTLFASFLFTYRVNSGTVFYAGYDESSRRSDQIDPVVFPTTSYRRTNRAVFAKLQYLFRY